MQAIADAFMDSAWWEVVQWLSIALGLAALFSLLLDRGLKGWAKARVWGGLGLLTFSVVFSMIFEDLLPTLRTLPPDHRLPFILSFPGFLAATALIVYGGWRFVRDTFGLTDGFGRSGSDGREPGRLRSRKKRQRLPARRLLRAWLPGLCWMAGGFALFFLAASAHHENHFPLPWLWALFPDVRNS